MDTPGRVKRMWTPMSSPADAHAGELFTDLSSNDGGGFNAGAYASAGHLLVMLKATEDLGFLNPDYQQWVRDAHAHRLGVAHYHFCRPENGDPIGEARWFWHNVQPGFRAGVDRLVLDLEVGDPNTWQAYIEQFDAELERISTLMAILYTFGSAIGRVRVRSNKYHVASWGTQQPSGAHRALANGGTLWAWQYTDGQVDPSGGPTRAAGANGGMPVDMSVLNPATVRSLRENLKR